MCTHRCQRSSSSSSSSSCVHALYTIYIQIYIYRTTGRSTPCWITRRSSGREILLLLLLLSCSFSAYVYIAVSRTPVMRAPMTRPRIGSGRARCAFETAAATLCVYICDTPYRREIGAHTSPNRWRRRSRVEHVLLLLLLSTNDGDGVSRLCTYNARW